jgi:hypothetical protein
MVSQSGALTRCAAAQASARSTGAGAVRNWRASSMRSSSSIASETVSASAAGRRSVRTTTATIVAASPARPTRDTATTDRFTESGAYTAAPTMITVAQA